MIVGEKDRFAIEWAENSKVSPVRLWIEDEYIGTLDDSQSLGIVSYQLCELARRLNLLKFLKESSDSTEDIFNKLLLESSGKHLVSLGDNFDDFCILVYTSNEKLNFIWKLESEPFFNYPEYGNEIKSGEVEVENFNQVLGDYKKKVDKIHG